MEKGIDITKHEKDIKRILFSKFGKMIVSNHLDPQDVLQEVLKGIHTRNQGKCPWTQDKGSMSNYIYIVCRGILYNLIRDLKSNPLHNNSTEIVEDTSIKENESYTIFSLKNQLERGSEIDKISAKMMPLLYSGHNQKEILYELGITPTIFEKGRDNLKIKIEAWI